MEYKGKLYGKIGNELIPLISTTDDVELLELKTQACSDILEHLDGWFNGKTLDPIRLKGLVGIAKSKFGMP